MIPSSTSDSKLSARLFRMLGIQNNEDGALQHRLSVGDEEDRCSSSSSSLKLMGVVELPLKVYGSDDEEWSSIFFPSSPRKRSSRRIQFNSTVRVVHIPSHSQYSDQIKKHIWASEDEIKMNARRNKREFAAEKYDWQQAVEEDEMFRDTYSNEYIHPVHLGRFLG